MQSQLDVYALLGPEEELHRYGPAFEYHQIGADIFGDLTNDDLKDIGVDRLGHRIKIMRQVKSFKQRSPNKKEPSSTALGSAESPTNSISQTSREVLRDMVNRIDYYESLVKRANDQIAYIRMDINKRTKNSDPLPDPGAHRGSTPSIASSASTLKASASYSSTPGTPGTSLGSMHQTDRHGDRYGDRYSDRHNSRHTDRHNDRHIERHSERHSDSAPNIASSTAPRSVRRVPYRQAHSIVIPSDAAQTSTYFSSSSAPTSALSSTLNELRKDEKRGSIMINHDDKLFSDSLQSPAQSPMQSPAQSPAHSSAHSSVKSPVQSSTHSSKRSSIQSPAQSPVYEDAMESTSSHSSMLNAF